MEIYNKENCSVVKNHQKLLKYLIEEHEVEIKRLKEDIHNPYKDFKVIEVPTACTFCPNHPSNGGSGNCNCTLGDIKITC